MKGVEFLEEKRQVKTNQGTTYSLFLPLFFHIKGIVFTEIKINETKKSSQKLHIKPLLSQSL